MPVKSERSSQHTAVIGMQWGDEGKGKVVDLLTAEHDLVVRYNGGANAGHTVVINGQKHAMHLLPSGILTPGKIAVIANGVVIDPEQLLNELKTLSDYSPEVRKNLRISDRAHVVMPWHKDMDRALEAFLAEQKNDRSIGTTGRGIGPCYSDRAARSTAVRMGDLLDKEKLHEKLLTICRVKNVQMSALKGTASVQFYDPTEITNKYAAYGEVLRDCITDTFYLLHDAVDSGKRILFEGANASLLDVDHGTYPFVTSSNCSALGIHSGTGLHSRFVNRVVGVMKAYSTRVGTGPFPTELNDATCDFLREKGHEYGTTTGRPRRCGWLDLVAVRYSAKLSGMTSLSVMLLDVLAGLDELKICTAYRYKGGTTERFIPDAVKLSEVEPVYDTLPGFNENITNIRDRNKLPKAARKYLERIEEYLDLPIELVSVGPDRNDTCREKALSSPAV